MALLQLNKAVTLHGAPSDPIVNVVAHNIHYFPNSWVNHIKTTYKDNIEFMLVADGENTAVEGDGEDLKKIKTGQQPSCCRNCLSKLSCLLVPEKINSFSKITIFSDTRTEKIMIKCKFFTIELPQSFLKKGIMFNGVETPIKAFISFLDNCSIIKGLGKKLLWEVRNQLVK